MVSRRRASPPSSMRVARRCCWRWWRGVAMAPRKPRGRRPAVQSTARGARRAWVHDWPSRRGRARAGGTGDTPACCGGDSGGASGVATRAPARAVLAAPATHAPVRPAGHAIGRFNEGSNGGCRPVRPPRAGHPLRDAASLASCTPSSRGSTARRAPFRHWTRRGRRGGPLQPSVGGAGLCQIPCGAKLVRCRRWWRR